MAELPNSWQKPKQVDEIVQRPLTGRFVLFCLLAFFAVVTAVNAIMIRFAVQTMPAIDVRNAYESSQNYNGDIARAHDQAALGWTANVEISKIARDGAISVSFASRDGEPVRGLQVNLKLLHPVNRSEDRNLVLKETSPGRYQGEVAQGAHGIRNLEVQARQNGRQVFRSRERVTL